MNLMSGAGLRLLRFCFLKRIIARVVSLREQLFQTVRRLAGNILYGNTLADVGGVVRTALRGINVQIPDELVVDDKSLDFFPIPCASYTSMWSISSLNTCLVSVRISMNLRIAWMNSSRSFSFSPISVSFLRSFRIFFVTDAELRSWASECTSLMPRMEAHIHPSQRMKLTASLPAA